MAHSHGPHAPHYSTEKFQSSVWCNRVKFILITNRAPTINKLMITIELKSSSVVNSSLVDDHTIQHSTCPDIIR